MAEEDSIAIGKGIKFEMKGTLITFLLGRSSVKSKNIEAAIFSSCSFKLFCFGVFKIILFNCSLL